MRGAGRRDRDARVNAKPGLSSFFYSAIRAAGECKCQVIVFMEEFFDLGGGSKLALDMSFINAVEGE